MNNIAIIYHDADFDGKLSNEVCRFHLSRLHPDANIHSYGWDYGRPIPDDEQRTYRITVEGGSANTTYQWEDYDAIYIVDLSVDELMSRPELREKIVWIDHHKSAIEKWDGIQNETETQYVKKPFDGIRIDGVAACRLCWQWFVRRTRVGVTYTRPVSKQDFVDRVVEEPELIRLAGEYDVWDHRDQNAKELQFGLRACNQREFDHLVQEQFNDTQDGDVILSNVIGGGRMIKSYCDKQADEYSATYSHTIKWEGLTFCALNIGQRGNSDLLRGGIKPEHDALFAWRFDGKQCIVSLYHIEGKTHHDLSLIAVKYGGGGHKGACGFRLTLPQLNAILCQ